MMSFGTTPKDLQAAKDNDYSKVKCDMDTNYNDTMTKQQLAAERKTEENGRDDSS